jgi:RNA polymerase sigma-70 factor, ECF subfamily
MEDKEFEERLLGLQSYLSMYAKRLTYTTPRYEWEDLVQDTNLKAWEKRHMFVYDDSFKGWLCTIAFNIWYTTVQERSRMYFIDSELVQYALDTNTASYNTVFSDLSIETINEAIDTLTLRSRFIVRQFLAGKKHQETADALGTTENSVRQGYFKGIRKVRDIINKNN